MSDVFKEIYSDKKDNLSRAFTGDISYFQIFWKIKVTNSAQKKKKKKKMNKRLAYLILKYLIVKVKHTKKKNTKCLNMKYRTFTYSFIWTHILVVLTRLLIFWYFFYIFIKTRICWSLQRSSFVPFFLLSEDMFMSQKYQHLPYH